VPDTRNVILCVFRGRDCRGTCLTHVTPISHSRNTITLPDSRNIIPIPTGLLPAASAVHTMCSNVTVMLQTCTRAIQDRASTYYFFKLTICSKCLRRQSQAPRLDRQTCRRLECHPLSVSRRRAVTRRNLRVHTYVNVHTLTQD